ncbi:MAG TPA: DoxX family protein [Acidimicrobiia bacterium]|nr:DoxX family protein [Acidimicrobiia bacterium]
MNDVFHRLTRSRFHGRGAYVTAAIRIVSGAVFVSVSTGKFVDHMQEATDFKSYGVPIPNTAFYVVGVLELVGGLLLLTGLFTRMAAVLLAANMVGAISTAGAREGGSFNLGLAPALLVAMLFLLWAGPGALALDGKLRHGGGTRPALPD